MRAIIMVSLKIEDEDGLTADDDGDDDDYEDGGVANHCRRRRGIIASAYRQFC